MVEPTPAPTPKPKGPLKLTVLYKVKHEQMLNITGLIYYKGKIMSVVQTDISSAPKLVFHNYVDTEFNNRDKSTMLSKIEISKLLNENVFTKFNVFGGIDSRKRMYLNGSEESCYYYTQQGDYFQQVSLPSTYPRHGCAPMASKADQLKVACFIYNCSSGMHMTVSTNFSDFSSVQAEEQAGDFHFLYRKVPSTTFLKSELFSEQLIDYQSDGCQNGCYLSSIFKMKSFAVARHYKVKSKFYIMNKNSTLFTYYYTHDNRLRLKQMTDIPGLQNTLVTGMTVAYNYLWVLLPFKKAIAKVCLDKYKVHEVIDLREFLKEVDQTFELETNVKEIFKDHIDKVTSWTDIYPLTAITYVH